MDVADIDGYPKCKLVVYFIQKRKRQIRESQIRIRLKDYSQIDEFMENLIKYPDLNIEYYDTDFSPETDKEI